MKFEIACLNLEPFLNGVPMRYIIVLAITLIAATANASELTANELQQYCGEVTKGSEGNSFDKELAQRCSGYMAGFFDSMIVIEKVTEKKEFCIPNSLPKTQNTLILSRWISENKEIAPKTTAAVALYAAFKKAFPCEPQVPLKK
jgi:hypothetical protein